MRMEARIALSICLLALIPAVAMAARVPLGLTEKNVEDVEVCRDAVCDKLREQILVEAYRCRPLAKFKKGSVRGQPLILSNSCGYFGAKNFRTSKGVCSRAVRAATRHAGMDSAALKDNAYNLQKKGLLEQAGFVNMIWKYNEDTAPLGSILIYVGGRGHNYGHIEVRANPHLYCSDHCSDRPISEHNSVTSRRYKLSGVYLPFSSSIQTASLVD
jgi:hypothetical protein